MPKSKVAQASCLFCFLLHRLEADASLHRFAHRDVAAKRRLNFHRDFWSDECRRPVDVILKINAVLGDFAQLGERKDLVTAAIGQDWSIPIHEAMQSAKMPD